MGRDNPPKERQRQQLERKLGKRAGHDRILIVSEGSKTEPQYFDEIRIELRLHTANVVVRPSELGTAPIQVVRYAEQLFLKGDQHKKIQPRAFEQVYAIFDRDDHDSYVEALDAAKSLDGKLRNDVKQLVKFSAIASVPNFELWLLLHFEEIQAPLHRDDVLSRLKRHLPGYKKGDKNIYAKTQQHLSLASQRAEKLAEKCNAYDDPQPFTDIMTLVSLLTNLIR